MRNTKDIIRKDIPTKRVNTFHPLLNDNDKHNKEFELAMVQDQYVINKGALWRWCRMVFIKGSN
jgi:hypothetical protein